MRGVIIRDDAQEEAWIYDSIRSEHKEETLELLQIHIGFYRDREISPQGVEQIRKVFQDVYKRQAMTGPKIIGRTELHLNVLRRLRLRRQTEE